MRKNRFISFFRIGFPFLILTFVLGVAPTPAVDDGAYLAEQFLKKIPLSSYDQAMTVEQAMLVQAQFIMSLKPTFGEVVGYKAGLTNPDVQKAFGVNHPLRGTLLKKMLLTSGAEVEANFGSRPLRLRGLSRQLFRDHVAADQDERRGNAQGGVLHRDPFYLEST